MYAIPSGAGSHASATPGWRLRSCPNARSPSWTSDITVPVPVVHARGMNKLDGLPAPQRREPGALQPESEVAPLKPAGDDGIGRAPPLTGARAEPVGTRQRF